MYKIVKYSAEFTDYDYRNIESGSTWKKDKQHEEVLFESEKASDLMDKYENLYSERIDYFNYKNEQITYVTEYFFVNEDEEKTEILYISKFKK